MSRGSISDGPQLAIRTRRESGSFSGGNVTSAGWCDPMWHASSRSGVATLRTAIHLLLTYLRNSEIAIDPKRGLVA